MTPAPVRHRAAILTEPVPLYFEEFQPGNERAPIVVLVHGGAMTGACYLSTPDGRPGWAHRFAGHGFRVVVVDWPGTGRSGPVVDDLLTGELICEALGALIEFLGEPVTLVTHSMSGPYGFRVLESHAHLVRSLVAVAPGPPGNVQPEPRIVRESADEIEIEGAVLRWVVPKHGGWRADRDFLMKKMVGASSRFPQSALRNYGATLLPIPASLLLERQNVKGAQLRVYRTERYRDKPVLVVTGSADTDHPRSLEQLTVEWLEECGADVTFRFLDSPEFAGNGHLLMAEDNSDAIADDIAAWLFQHQIRSPNKEEV